MYIKNFVNKITTLLAFLIVIALNSEAQWNTLSSGGSNVKDYYTLDFINPDTGYLAGYDYNNFSSIVLKTINGGVSWDTNYIPIKTDIPDMFFITADTGYILFMSKYISKTTNGGVTWDSIVVSARLEYFKAIHFISSTTGYIVGDKKRLLKTTNGGSIWNEISYDSLAIYDPYYDIQFVNPNNGFIVGGNQMNFTGKILRTTNGGSTWDTTVLSNSYPLHTVHFVTDSIGFAVSYYQIYKTIDAGNSWKLVVTSTGNMFFNSIYFTDENTGYNVGNTGVIFKTSDGGLNWSIQSTDITESISDIIFTDNNTGYAVGYFGSIIKTTNGGGSCPVANFEISPNVGCYGAPSSFNFFGLSFLPDTLDSITSYYWDFGDGIGAATNQNPYYTFNSLDTFEITLYVKNSYNCISTHLDTIIVASECVWPGDANHDGIANNFDLFALGIAFGDTGSARTNTTIDWEPQVVNDWKDSLANGTNFKHIDCNGNAVINALDADIILNNYNKSHQKTSETFAFNSANPDLFFELNTDTAFIGDTVIATIMLGTTVQPASNIYGVAFSIAYNPLQVDSSISVSFTSSWLGTSGTDMINLSKKINDEGKLDIALCRSNNIPRTGDGILLKTTFVMVDNISGGVFTLDFKDVKLIDTAEALITVNPKSDSLVVINSIKHIDKLASSIHLYPNPASNRFIINSTVEKIRGIKIFNILGEKVYENNISNLASSESKKIEIDLTAIPAGNYLICIETSAGTVNKIINIF